MEYRNGTPINWKELMQQEASGLSAHWGQYFLQLLRTENCSLEVHADLGRLLEDNLSTSPT